MSCPWPIVNQTLLWLVVAVPNPCLSASVQTAVAPGVPGAKAAPSVGLPAETEGAGGSMGMADAATAQIKPSRRGVIVHLANQGSAGGKLVVGDR